MRLVVPVAIFLSLFYKSHASRCMTPDDARYVVPFHEMPDSWKNSENAWHTGDYFPSPGIAMDEEHRGILHLTPENEAARMFWVEEHGLYKILTRTQDSILCTLIGAGLQVGWIQMSPEANSSDYCQWHVEEHPTDPDGFKITNAELKGSISTIGSVYVERTGLYFDYHSNRENDPANVVDEAKKWWRWKKVPGIQNMARMAELPPKCPTGATVTGDEDEVIMGRSIGGGKGRRTPIRITSRSRYAICSNGWFLLGRKCYRFYTSPNVPFRTSERVCAALNGSIVLPQSDKENSFVRYLIRRHAPRVSYWIRARVDDDMDSFRLGDFKDHGRELAFKKINRLRSRRAKCLTIGSGGYWKQTNCLLKSSTVMCEKSAEPTVQGNCGRIMMSEWDGLMLEESGIVKGKQNLDQRVVGGSLARHGMLPWQAAIRFKHPVNVEGFTVYHSCGGALIDHYYVLTAAHCFLKYPPSEFRVRIGDYNNVVPDGTEQEFEIVDFAIHESYKSEPSHINDIALLKLSDSAFFNQAVQPVCLPDSRFSFSDEGQKCQVAGWGLTNLDLGQASAPKLLHFVTLPTMKDSLCSRRYNRRNRPRLFYAGQMRCAGYKEGGKDACAGDSGGPYVCRNEDGLYAVLGIVSFGIGCGHRVYPGVYTNVPNYIPWITQKIRTLGDGILIQ